MKLQVNGETRFVEINSIPPNLSNIMKALGYNPTLVVVEFNGAIITPITWSEQLVKNGDTLEIVSIVGGGS